MPIVNVHVKKKSSDTVETMHFGLSHGYNASRKMAGGEVISGAMLEVMKLIQEHHANDDVESFLIEVDKTKNVPLPLPE